MWNSNNPMFQVQKLKEVQERYRVLLVGLLGVIIILVIDLLYLAPKSGSFLTSFILSPLTLLLMCICLFLIYNYLKNDLKIHRLNRNMPREEQSQPETQMKFAGRISDEFYRSKGIENKMKIWIMNIKN